MGEKKIEDETIYCEWCGKYPYYIAVYDKDSEYGEICLCKFCYEESEM